MKKEHGWPIFERFFLSYLIKQFSINANPLKLKILSAIISRIGFQTKEKNRPLRGIN